MLLREPDRAGSAFPLPRLILKCRERALPLSSLHESQERFLKP